MTISELSRVIREKMCAEIRVSDVAENRLAVATPLTFGDGDACRLFVLPQADGSFTVTDGGHVLALGYMEGVDLLADGYSERFRQLAAFYGASESAGELRLKTSLSEMGDAVFSLTQACLESAKLIESPPEMLTKKRAFMVRFVKSVTRAIPQDRLTKNWTDKASDPKGVYKADFRVEKNKMNWLIMGAGSPSKCWKSASTVQHHKANRVPIQTVFAYGESTKSDSSAFEVMLDNASHNFSLVSERKAFEEFLRENLSTN